MRRIGNGLHAALHPLAAQLIHHQRQQYGHREIHNQRINAQAQSVANQLAKLIAFKKALKVVKPAPRTARNALYRGKFLEGNLHAVHGHIMKNNEINQHRQKHQVKLPVAQDPFPEPPA